MTDISTIDTEEDYDTDEGYFNSEDEEKICASVTSISLKNTTPKSGRSFYTPAIARSVQSDTLMPEYELLHYHRWANGTSASPYLVFLDVNNPERNREFGVCCVTGITHQSHLRNGFHI